MANRIVATLPYPPSVNHYWVTVVVKRGARYVPVVRVGESGVRYRQSVANALRGVPTHTGRLDVRIVVSPPDRRTRDLDNTLKAILDSCTHAGLWADDGQIDRLTVVRGDQVDGGLVTMAVEQIPTESEATP